MKEDDEGYIRKDTEQQKWTIMVVVDTWDYYNVIVMYLWDKYIESIICCQKQLSLSQSEKSDKIRQYSSDLRQSGMGNKHKVKLIRYYMKQWDQISQV